MPKLAGHSQSASVRFDNGLGDRQSHAGSLHSIALISSAIELVEDERLLKVINARSPIAHTGHKFPIAHFRTDRNRRLGG